MKNLKHPLLLRGLLAACTLALSAPALAAENWPQAPVRWIVGFAPGGTADVLTRIAAEQLGEKLGQSVVVENRPGASGSIALQFVAKADPKDTLLITVPGPIIFPRPEPSVGKELAPVVLLAQGPMIITGPSKNPENTLQEVIASAKANPGRWNYATSGTGTSQHLAGELVNDLAGVQMTQIPYKGGGQAVTDVVGAQVPLAILGPTPVLPHLKSGALKPYAVTTTYRLPSLPQVPTVQEAGIKGYDATQWFAVATTQGAPADRIAKVNALLNDIMKTDKFKTAVEAAGMITGPSTPQQTEEFIGTDAKKWAELVKSRNLNLGG